MPRKNFRNEAENEGYRGFHQWNISQENGKLIIWNKSGKIDVANTIGECADVRCEISGTGRIVAVIKK